MGKEKYYSRTLLKRIESINKITLMINQKAQEIVKSIDTLRKENIKKLEILKSKYLSLLASENIKGQKIAAKTKIISNYSQNTDIKTLQNYFSQQFFEEKIIIRGIKYSLKILKNDYNLQIKGHSGRVTGVALTSDNKYAIISDLDNTVRIWNLRSNSQELSLEGKKGWIDTLLLSQDDKYILFSGDKSIKIYNLHNKTLEFSLENTKIYPNSVLISHDNSYIAYGTDENIRIFDFHNKNEITLLKGHYGLVKFVGATYDPNIIISCSENNDIFIWDIKEKNQKIIEKIKNFARKVNCIASGHNSKYAVFGRADKILVLFCIQNPEEKTQLIGHNYQINSAVITYSNNYIVSSAYFEILIWNINNKSIEGKLVGHTRNVISLYVSKDEKFVLSGGETARLWDFQNKSQKNVLEGHRDKINFISSTSDNKFIVSCDKESLRIWSVQEKKQISVIKENFHSNSMSLTRNNYLVIGEGNKKIRVLKISSLLKDRNTY